DARFVDGGDETEGIGSRMSVAGIERIPYDHSSAGLEIVHFSPSSVERVLSQPKTPWTAAVTGVAGGVDALRITGTGERGIRARAYCWRCMRTIRESFEESAQ